MSKTVHYCDLCKVAIFISYGLFPDLMMLQNAEAESQEKQKRGSVCGTE